MTPSQPEQHQGPYEPADPQLAQRQEEHAQDLRDHSVAPREKRVENMSAIQLPDRMQVDGGCEHSYPRGPGDRVQVNIDQPHALKNGVREQPLEPGDAEVN